MSQGAHLRPKLPQTDLSSNPRYPPHSKGGGGAWFDGTENIDALLLLGCLDGEPPLGPAPACPRASFDALPPPLEPSPLPLTPDTWGIFSLNIKSCASCPIIVILSTTVLKLSHLPHCTPKKCQDLFTCTSSQSLHFTVTTLHNSGGTGCNAIPIAMASHVGFIRSCVSAVFLHMGHRES